MTRSARIPASAAADVEAAEPLVALRYASVGTASHDSVDDVVGHALNLVAPEASTGSPTVTVEATAGTPPQGGPCSEQRRVADERCAVAARAREHAEGVLREVRAAQLAYDDHQSRAERAALAADPRTVRTAKEVAQHEFRANRAAARTPESVEAAARGWLTEINRINHEAREASQAAAHERDTANQLVTRIERLTAEADAARTSAEEAEIACLAARQVLAECQEADPLDSGAGEPSAEPAAAGETLVPAAVGESGSLDDAGAGSEHPAVIIRLLRGDRGTLEWLAAELGGPDPAERRRCQVAIGGLLEAIIARAIDASALDFPPEHSFWSTFTRDQGREIVGALASLGFRFDGLGGWVDDRVPSQRDLSLAVGYAGLDPMRIRHWPSEADTQNLFLDVSVAADRYLVETAGGLTLGELISLLGRRADELTDVWNDWGRIRPLLLAA